MVSVIIVTYNTRQMTSECIDSIFAKTVDVDFEVILVDNASSDGSKVFFENDRRIKYVYSKDNLGFGRGNNLGLQYAKGDYIFLLNSDTLLVNNAIKLFYDYLKKSPLTIGCVGCVLQGNNGQRVHSYHSTFPTLLWILKEVVYYSIPKLYNPYRLREKLQSRDVYPKKVAAITGADLFIRREVINECGLFDTDFFMYYEDTELQYRYQKNGFDSFVIDTPKIIHLAGASSKSKKCVLQKLRNPLKSRFLYAKKNFAPIHFVIFRIIHLLMIPRVLLSLSSIKSKLEILKIIFGPSPKKSL